MPCRVIGVVDGDDFEVQVYQLQPQYKDTIGTPTVVVDHNDLILSVSSEAKFLGVRRLDKRYKGLRLCPHLNVIEKRQRFLKPDTKLVQKASVGMRSAALDYVKDFPYADLVLGEDVFIEVTGCDEFYIDLTEIVNHCIYIGHKFEQVLRDRDIILEDHNGEHKNNRFINRLSRFRNGPSSDFRLAVGAMIISEICDAIYQKISIRCSGGVATNKLLAKLACKLHKPNAVTALTKSGFKRVSYFTPFHYMHGFGGDLGNLLKELYGEEMPIKHLQVILEMQRQNLEFNVGHYHVVTIERIIYGNFCNEVQHRLANKNVNSRKKRLHFQDISEFRTEFNILTQSILDKLQDEALFNKRFPGRIFVQYCFNFTRWMRNKQQRSFEMDDFQNFILDDNVENWQEAFDVKAFTKNAIDVACTNNPRFNQHLQFIQELNFRAVEFQEFGEIE